MSLLVQMQDQLARWGRAVQLQADRTVDCFSAPTAPQNHDALVEISLFVLSLRNLVRAAEKIAELRNDASSASALASFKRSIPDYNKIRIVIEHFDDHAVGELRSVRPTTPGGTITPLLLAFHSGSSRTLSLQGGPKIPIEPSGDAVLQIAETDSDGTIIQWFHLPLQTAASAAVTLVTALGRDAETP